MSIVTHIRLGAAAAVLVVATQAAIVHGELASAEADRAASLETTGQSLKRARLVQSALADALIAARIPHAVRPEPMRPVIRDAVARARANLGAIEHGARSPVVSGLIAALDEQLGPGMDARAIAEAAHAAASMANALAADAWRDSATITSGLDRADRTLIAGTVLLLVLTLALAVLVDRRIGRRLGALADAADALAAGDLRTPIEIGGTDEIAALAEPIERLRLTMHDLEHFAYAAAHDLKSPVVAIQDTLTWALEDFEETMPLGAQELIARAIARTDGLIDLQRGLLDYAVGANDTEVAEPVDIAAIAAEAHDSTPDAGPFELDTRAPGSITLPPLATRRIVANLVANAVRHHDQETGSITVTARLDDSYAILEIRDDGPGIAPCDHERVQQLFERDRSAGGSGLGLALVQKLAERAGGTMSIRSPVERGRGTAVTVTLALQDAG